MLVVRAMLGAAAEVIKMVYVEMVTHRFVPEWIDQNVSVMLGAADEVIEVAYVVMVIHVYVTEDEVDDRLRIDNPLIFGRNALDI
jgi:hypothetical protein